jgi:dTDP-4-dehydrorhamnose 3,5-epimerase
MKVTKCHLEGILLIEPIVFADNRGFFLESFEQQRYSEAGIRDRFIQENHSRSKQNVLRGLHFTKNKPQAQLLTVMRGRIFDVVVDLRRDSPTFGRWFGTELTAEGKPQIYMPHGFAHGFCVLSDVADLHYKVSQPYDPADEGGLRWNDPDIGIAWPVEAPEISLRDSAHPLLGELLGI